MAYNNLSGTVSLPNRLIRTEGYSTGIVSGNLSTSDGADVINVPRVSNPLTNGIVIDTGGDANTLRCESGLTFDGDTLNVVGEITASTGVSASFFMGDGSRLTGITSTGTGGGIFTETAINRAFTTSSINVGSNATPTKTLNVKGTTELSGGIIHKRVYKTSNYTIEVADYFIGVNSTGGAFQLTMPDAAASSDGQTWVIKDEGGSSHTNNITIKASGSQEIDGENSIVLESPYASIQLYSNGHNKFYIF